MTPENPEGPAQLGRYEIVTQLGEGGMALVHLAIAHGGIGFNKLVVVKQVRPELASDPEFVQMFRNEAEIAVLLRHPNVVETLEVFSEGGLHLIAMEFLEGHSLAELQMRLDRSRVPLEEQLHVLSRVLAGLQHAHGLRGPDGRLLEVVHRDVSPPNVFLTYDGQVKLVDFGIAKISGAVSQTERGTIKGKLGYCAPEQLLGGQIDGRADVFSVGVMMWEALAGRRRRVGDSRNALIEARLGGHEPRIRQIAPDVPAALAEICDRATAVDPGDRYPSARHMQLDLERVLRAMPRQVGQRELGALVSESFHSARLAMHQRIEGVLGGSQRTPTRDLTPHLPEEAALGSPGAVPAVAIEDSYPTVATADSAGAAFALAGQDPRSTLDAVVSPSESPPPPALSERMRLGIGAVLSFSMGILLVLAVSPRRDRQEAKAPAPATQPSIEPEKRSKPTVVNLERAPEKKTTAADKKTTLPTATNTVITELSPRNGAPTTGVPTAGASTTGAPGSEAPPAAAPAPATEDIQVHEMSLASKRPLTRRRLPRPGREVGLARRDPGLRPATARVESPARPVGIVAATRPVWTSTPAPAPVPVEPPPVAADPARAPKNVRPGMDLKQVPPSRPRSKIRIDESNPYQQP